MELLEQFGDLTAIASAAGLGGGALGVAGNLFFRGLIMRFIVRSLLTAVVTGVGFLFLLNYLGYEIKRKDDFTPPAVKSGAMDGRHSSSFDQAASGPAEADEDEEDKRVLYVSRPGE